MVRVAVCTRAKEKNKYIQSGLRTLAYEFHIKEFANIYDLLERFDNTPLVYDIVILDTTVHNEGDGITAAEHMRARNFKGMLLFVSESEAYYAQAFKVFAMAYFLYPFEISELEHCIDFYFQKTWAERRLSWMFKAKGGNWCRVFCRDIVYVESDNRQIIVHMQDGAVIESYAKLNQVRGELPDKGFVRCHQSYIVNLYYIDELKNNLLVIHDLEIPISRKYQKDVKMTYYNYMFSKM